MVGPDYKEPNLPVGNKWQGASTNKNADLNSAPPKTASWWKAFNDPTLTSLIEQGYRNNINTQIAGVRVLQSRALLAQSVGEQYPQTQVMQGDYTHYSIGGNQFRGILPPSFETASMGMSASWEIDFWGKYRRAVLSKNASFLSSLAAYDNALVSLTADIAATYTNVRTQETLIRVTNANIRLQAESLKIARSRYNAGQTSLLDVEQAKTSLAQTQASLPGIVSKLRQQKDKLAVLLGLTPLAIDECLNGSKPIPKPSSKIEVGIPREVLDRRPDIHQARLEAIAQSNAIGATKANLFPAFSLSGTFNFSSSNIGSSSVGNLFNWSNRNVTAGPSFVWPILNYGQITNAVRVQDALFQEKLLNYINTVLQAQQEVQDNITQYNQAKKARNTLARANRSAMSAVHIALVRYKEGETNYTTVLDAEREQLQVQTSLTNARGDIALAMIGLYRALGGGWQIRKGHDVVANSIKQQMAQRTNWGSLLIPENHEKPSSQSQIIKQLYLPSW